MNQKKLLALAEKHEQGNASEHDKEVLNTFLLSVQQSNKNLNTNPTEQNKLRIARQIESRIKNKNHAFNTARLVSYAALFIGLISVGVLSHSLLGDKYTTQRTAKGQKQTLVLEDGSKVFLNANSSITYPQDFSTNRKVKLSGEAFFEVHRDEQHPFTITTGTIKTQVLGTTFNINSYDEDEVRVSVNSGKVSVANTNTKEAVYLVKNQQVLFKENKSPLQSETDSEDQIAWTKNIISLHNTSLAKTAVILENWYNVQIDFENEAIEELKITGKFKNESLQNVLKSIALINNLKIDSLTQNHILIRKKLPAKN